MTDLPATPPLDPAPADMSVSPTGARPRSIKVNFMINVAGAIVPLGVSLVTVPIYIRHIGDARYGVLSIVWVLLGYFGFLDLGLSRAAANALARLRDAPQEARARVLVTTLVLNVGMGLVGSLALALAGSYLLQHVLNVPDALKPEIASAFPWIVALFPLALVSGVGIGALESREEFLRANILQVVGTSLGQVVPVMLAVAVGPSLAVVIPAAAIARGLTVVAILLMVSRREGPLRVRHFHREVLGSLLTYGSWVSVSGIVNPILASLDQFIIGILVSVEAVSHYSVAMNLVLRSQLFAAAISRTLFPRMSNVSPDQAKEIAAQAFKAITFGYSVVCAPSIILAPLFFSHWISPDFSAQAAPVATILLVGAWANSMAFIPVEFAQSQGRPDITGKIHAIEVIPFVAVLLLFTYYLGIVRASIAWTLRCAIDAAILYQAVRMNKDQILLLLIPATILSSSVCYSAFVGSDVYLSVFGASLAAGLTGALAFEIVRRPQSAALRTLRADISAKV